MHCDADRLIREVRNLAGDSDRDHAPDGHLLARFVDHRDESAFEMLVRRYGRLVFGVCRRVLTDIHTAEDAFQATFLVLVHKAATLSRTRPVADWLYTVAFRLASRARVNVARRRKHETIAEQSRAMVAEEHISDEGVSIVHEELSRLPDLHRVPLVLSYLEGHNYVEVARAIGCPVGSVGWRLTRAKELLRERLHHRGVACPAAGIALLISTAGASAAVPASLVESTVRAGMWFAGNRVVDAVPSAQALELARSVIGTISTSRWALVASVLLTMGLCGGTAWLARSAAKSDPAEVTPESIPAAHNEARPGDVPEGATARMGTTQFRHGDAVFFIAYAANGKNLITAGRDNTIRMWDRTSGRELRRFERATTKKELLPAKPSKPDVMTPGKMMQASGNPDFPVALSPDGKTLAAAKDRTITVWDTASGKTLQELTAADGVFELIFTPDGQSLVSGDSSQTVTLWDPVSGKTQNTFTLKGRAEGGGAIKTGTAISPAGTHFVLQILNQDTANGALRIHDLVSGEAKPDIKLSAGGAQNITFSRDGKLLAWSSFTDGVTVWDIVGHKELARFGGGMVMKPRFFGKSLRISDDAKTIAVTLANDTIELWDIASGKLIRKMGGYEEERHGRVAVRVMLRAGERMTQSDLAFAPDGRTIALSLGNATVRQFDTESGKEIAATPGHLSAVIAVGSHGHRVVSISRESIRVWDAHGSEVRSWPLTPPAVSAAISSDASLVALASGSGIVRIWDTTKGQKVREVDTKRADVAGVAFSLDGKLLATKAELNSAVNIWNATTGEHVRTIGQDGEPVFSGGRVMLDFSGMQTPAIAFACDGRLAAATGDKKQLCVWDVATGSLLCEFSTPERALGVAFGFSADGHVIAMLLASGATAAYEIATGEKRFETKSVGDAASPARPREMMGGAMAANALGRGNANGGAIGFSRDGRFVLSSAGSPTLQIWDLVTAQEAGQLRGHEGSLTHICVSPSGQTLVTGSVDTTALSWELAKLARIEPARGTPLTTTELDSLWSDLARADAAVAFAATRKLLTDRRQVAALLGERLRPLPSVDEARMAELVAELGGAFETRRKAASELERLGELAVPRLQKALEENPKLELK